MLRSGESPLRGCPKTSFNRLPASQGIATFVLSSPAAINKSLPGHPPQGSGCASLNYACCSGFALSARSGSTLGVDGPGCLSRMLLGCMAPDGLRMVWPRFVCPDATQVSHCRANGSTVGVDGPGCSYCRRSGSTVGVDGPGCSITGGQTGAKKTERRAARACGIPTSAAMLKGILSERRKRVHRFVPR